MDDPYGYLPPEPDIYIIYSNSTPDEIHLSMNEADLAEFGVKIISYEFDEPIDNTYESKLTFSLFVPSIN
jgi:hypothetical protein